MITSAEGVEGQLIYTATGRYVFRVYSDNYEFIDYDLLHTDLSITITDSDSTLYSNENGCNELDHSPETLGIK